jgi:xylulokinase
MPAGGFCVDWFIHKVLGRTYEYLDHMKLSETEAMFLPNLRSMTEHLPPGGFTRLSDRDTGETLLQSIMEALAFESRSTLTEAFDAKGMSDEFEELVLVGGVAFNPHFIKILAHTLNRPVKVHRYPQSAAAFGCALAAGVASGRFKSCDEAVAHVSFGEWTTPDDEKFTRYLDAKFAHHSRIFRGV